MRLLHFADLHLGVERYGQPVPGRGWNTHTEDILAGFDYLVAYALDNGIDAVVFAGDAFKSREPTQTQQREFATRIRRLSEAGIAVYLLTGNHDLPNAEGRAHALELYRTLDVPGVYVGDNTWFQVTGLAPRLLQTRSGPLQVVSLPWPAVSRLVGASDEAREMELTRLQHRVAEEIDQLIARQVEGLDPDVPAVLVGHITVDDWAVKTNPGSEQWMTIHSAPAIFPSLLRAGKLDYVALGHHHNNIELSVESPGWYSGSLQAIDFGDEGLRKGFMVVDVDPAKARGSRVGGSGVPRLVEIPRREFVSVMVAPRNPDPTMEILERIDAASIDNAVVRLHAEMSREQQQALRLGAVRERLNLRAHYVAGINISTPREQRMKLPAGQQPDALDPLEALDMYLRAKEYPDDRRQKLRNAARGLIASVQEKQ